MGILKFFTLPFILLCFHLIFPAKLEAFVNPHDFSNNNFGIHILDPVDLPAAKELVNSSGGDWGYVTFVIQENDRDLKKWQNVFNQMRSLHLIPIVRIASHQEKDGWKKLEKSDIDSWIYFLNSLKWVIKNRYLVVGNEPNHATEWGNEINPQEYADYFIEFSSKAKDASEDFFVIPAGLDASAPDNKDHMSEENFLKAVLTTHNDFFEYADGFSSHSYPNPDFAGSEYARGKGSIRTYEWEINLLEKLNVNKYLPIFITETGWKHNDDGEIENSKSSLISQKFEFAYRNVWNDPRIVAVTPFVLNYHDEPFYSFSWKKKDGSFFPFYDQVKNIPKIKGAPYQEESGEILFLIAPNIANRGSTIKAMAVIKNTGQTIWEKDKVSIVEIVGNKTVTNNIISQDVEPEQKIIISLNLYAPDTKGDLSASLKFMRGKKQFGKEYKFQMLILKPLFSDMDIFNNLRQVILINRINLFLGELRSLF
jgi:hypothetical protein